MKRRAVLRAIERIVDANDIDELVSGPPDDAAACYAVLRECARGEAGRCFEVICQVATRRGVTPGYLVDRADVLLGTAEMRRDNDLYHILGVRPLASDEEIRDQWREVVKRCHPDLVGEGGSDRFRAVQSAYGVLGDPDQRAQYERLWQERLAGITQARTMAEAVELEIPPASTRRAGRALRVLAGRVAEILQAPPQNAPAPAPGAAGTLHEGVGLGEAPSGAGGASVAAGETTAHDAAQRPRAKEENMDDVLRRSVSMLEAVRGIDQRLAGAGFDGVEAVAKAFEQLHKAVAGVSLQEIDATLGDIDQTRRALDTISRDLTRLRRLKQSLDDSTGR